MDLLIENIRGLVLATDNPSQPLCGSAMRQIPILKEAYLFIRDGIIYSYGNMPNKGVERADRVIDATGKFVFPSFVDSHTHLVFAGSRENEFVDRINGLGYAEIARKGGGILNSAKLIQQTSEQQLYESALQRVYEVITTGTGAIEIKSGYGLTTRDELKILRVVRRLRENVPIPVKSTFLGAHAIPGNSTREEYVKKVIDEMIPAVADQGLADYCDVFCEEGFFSPLETSMIVEQGLKYGLKPRLHANQLSRSGGVQVGVQHNAISVDHLETVGDEEIEMLKNSSTIPTLLPAAAFFLDMHFPPAKRMIEAGLPVALASDYNPGSSPTGNIPLVIALACIKMKMTPSEAIVAATINAAWALECHNELGTISPGKRANVFITKPMPTINYLPYAFGSNLVETVILKGQIFRGG